MQTGTRFGYSVIQWSDGFDPSLDNLLAALPSIVLNRYVAIASCDSGSYKPTKNDWLVQDGIAISPKITSLAELPTPGFDEWYIYEQRPASYALQHFVNTLGFSPLAFNDEVADPFWAQIEATYPLHVLGAGTPNMFLVTRDIQLAAIAKTLPLP